MSMLAEKKRKQKFSLNPRGNHWSQDNSKYGQKMLEKMGWSKGKGLGANLDGKTDHIRVVHKNDSTGIGYKDHENEKWYDLMDNTDKLLASFTPQYVTHSTDDETDEETTDTSMKETLQGNKREKKQKIYLHYGNLIESKQPNKRTQKDWDRILGKRPKGNNNMVEEDEKQTIETTNPDFGVETYNKGSMSDYFNKKIKNGYKTKSVSQYHDERNSDSENETRVGFGFTSETTGSFNISAWNSSFTKNSSINNGFSWKINESDSTENNLESNENLTSQERVCDSENSKKHKIESQEEVVADREKKKKKKRKCLDLEEQCSKIIVENQDLHQKDASEDNILKSKKSKKSRITLDQVAMFNDETKKKKKKKKKESNDLEQKSSETSDENFNENEAVTEMNSENQEAKKSKESSDELISCSPNKKKKKKKRNAIEENSSEVANESLGVNENGVNKKKVCSNLEESYNQDQENETNIEIVGESKKSKKRRSLPDEEVLCSQEKKKRKNAVSDEQCKEIINGIRETVDSEISTETIGKIKKSKHKNEVLVCEEKKPKNKEGDSEEIDYKVHKRNSYKMPRKAKGNSINESESTQVKSVDDSSLAEDVAMSNATEMPSGLLLVENRMMSDSSSLPVSKSTDIKEKSLLSLEKKHTSGKTPQEESSSMSSDLQLVEDQMMSDTSSLPASKNTDITEETLLSNEKKCTSELTSQEELSSMSSDLQLVEDRMMSDSSSLPVSKSTDITEETLLSNKKKCTSEMTSQEELSSMSSDLQLVEDRMMSDSSPLPASKSTDIKEETPLSNEKKPISIRTPQEESSMSSGLQLVKDRMMSDSSPLPASKSTDIKDETPLSNQKKPISGRTPQKESSISSSLQLVEDQMLSNASSFPSSKSTDIKEETLLSNEKNHTSGRRPQEELSSMYSGLQLVEDRMMSDSSLPASKSTDIKEETLLSEEKKPIRGRTPQEVSSISSGLQLFEDRMMSDAYSLPAFESTDMKQKTPLSLEKKHTSGRTSQEELPPISSGLQLVEDRMMSDSSLLSASKCSDINEETSLSNKKKHTSGRAPQEEFSSGLQLVEDRMISDTSTVPASKSTDIKEGTLPSNEKRHYLKTCLKLTFSPRIMISIAKTPQEEASSMSPDLPLMDDQIMSVASSLPSSKSRDVKEETLLSNEKNHISGTTPQEELSSMSSGMQLVENRIMSDSASAAPLTASKSTDIKEETTLPNEKKHISGKTSQEEAPSICSGLQVVADRIMSDVSSLHLSRSTDIKEETLLSTEKKHTSGRTLQKESSSMSSDLQLVKDRIMSDTSSLPASKSTDITEETLLSNENKCTSEMTSQEELSSMSSDLQLVEDRMMSVSSSLEEETPLSHDKKHLSGTTSEEESSSGITRPLWILRGSHSQSSRRYSNFSRNNQCTAMAVMSLAFAKKICVDNWNMSVIDKILEYGDDLYHDSVEHRNFGGFIPEHADYLHTDEVCPKFVVNGCNFLILFNESNNIDGLLSHEVDSCFPMLLNGLLRCFANYEMAVLTGNLRSVSVLKYLDKFYVFDSHSRNKFGLPCRHGKACLLCFDNLTDMTDHLIECLSGDAETQYCLCPVYIECSEQQD